MGSERLYEFKLVSFFDEFIQRWATPPGSIGVRVPAIPASPAARDDTGLWKGDCSAVMIRCLGYRETELSVAGYVV